MHLRRMVPIRSWSVPRNLWTTIWFRVAADLAFFGSIMHLKMVHVRAVLRVPFREPKNYDQFYLDSCISYACACSVILAVVSFSFLLRPCFLHRLVRPLRASQRWNMWQSTFGASTVCWTVLTLLECAFLISLAHSWIFAMPPPGSLQPPIFSILWSAPFPELSS